MVSSRSTALLLTGLCIVGVALTAALIPAVQSGTTAPSEDGSAEAPALVETVDSLWPETIPQAVILSLTVIVPVVGAWLLYTSRDPWSKVTSLASLLVITAVFFMVVPNSGELLQPISVSNESLQEGLQSGSPLLAVLPLAVLLVAVAVVFGASESATFDDPDELDDDTQPSSREMSAAAKRAADYIEASDGAASNAIYDAWREMTTVLDVEDPQSSTPGEFATAAVDAGMDSSDVEEITRLFEAVRYGDQPPSADRERRAVAALRRIERTHAIGAADGQDGEPTGGSDRAGGVTDDSNDGWSTGSDGDESR